VIQLVSMFSHVRDNNFRDYGPDIVPDGGFNF